MTFYIVTKNGLKKAKSTSWSEIEKELTEESGE